MQPVRRDEQILVLAGRCYDRESVPYKAIDSIIPSLVSFLRRRASEELSSLLPGDALFLARLFPLINRLDAINESESDISQVESEKVRFRGFRAFKELMIEISRRWPIVILIDDLQWADSESASPIHQLLCGDDAPAILFLGSYRRDEAGDSRFLEAWQASVGRSESSINESTIALRPLTRDECVELVTTRTGVTASLIQHHADELLADTGGNPYFFEQLLEGFDPATGQLQTVPLLDIIRARLSRLPHEAIQLLESVCVSGQPLAIDELEGAAGLERSALEILTHMRSEKLVRLIGADVEPVIDTFHDRIRETVLQHIGDEARLDRHRDIAENIEAKVGLSTELVLRSYDSLTGESSLASVPGCSESSTWPTTMLQVEIQELCTTSLPPARRLIGRLLYERLTTTSSMPRNS